MVEKFEIYKVTTVNRDGKEMVAYCLPAIKQNYVRSMMEEYGNSTAVGMMFADVPPDINIPR